MYYLKLFLSLARFILTKPTVLLLFLAGLYCLYIGIVLVLGTGF